MNRKRDFLPSDHQLLQMEQTLHSQGFCFVAGVDEAGRGPLAGPVMAAAVILPRLPQLPGVFDSKQLTAAEREELRAELEALPGIAFGIASATAAEIDELNILRATHLAMFRAVEKLPQTDFVLVDGLPVHGFPVPARNVVKGDALCAAIAAASIFAKVERDRFMTEAEKEYPGYGFAEHKGYGTAAHLAALKKLGPCPLHRRSFRPVRECLEGAPEQLALFGE